MRRPPIVPFKDRLGYSLGDREAFATFLGQAARTRPALSEWTTPEEADPTRALLDAWATSLDVLAFYNARLAEDHYWRTATDPEALRRLAAQIGYRPAPPTSAQADIQFFTDEALGAPVRVEVPVGTRVQSVPGPGERPQTYETDAPLTAYRSLNRIPLRSTKRIGAGARQVFRFRGVGTDLKVGDLLLIVSGANREPRRITRAEKVPEADAVEVEIGTMVGVAEEGTEVYVLRQKAAVFGYNALPYAALPDETTGNTGFPTAAQWADQTLTGSQLDLDSVYPGVGPGGWAVLQVTGGAREIRRISSADERPRTDFLLSAKVTHLVLDGNVPAGATARNLAVFTSSERLELAPLPASPWFWGDKVPLDAVPPELRPPLGPGRRVAVRGRAVRLRVTGEVPLFSPEWPAATPVQIATLPVGSEVRVLKFLDLMFAFPILLVETDEGVTGILGGGTVDIAPARDGDPIVAETVAVALDQGDAEADELKVEPRLQGVYWRAESALYGNLVAASHGESHDEVLGSGSGSSAFASYPPSFQPLSRPAGGEPALDVYVDGVRWERVPTFYGQEADARVYTLAANADGRERVEFGDGQNGARPPTGQANLRAIYRAGAGEAGRVRAGGLQLLINRPLGLQGAENPGPAVGGTDGERPEDLRRSMPGFARALDRIVAPEDLEDFARRYPGVAQAQADVLWNGNQEVLFVTVVPSAPGALDFDALRGAVDAARDGLFPVQVEEGPVRSFALRLEVRPDPAHVAADVLADVEARLREGFALRQRQPAEGVTASEVAHLAHEASGVLGVRLLALHPAGTPEALTDPLLANPARYEDGRLKPAETWILHPALLGVEEMADVL